jgi:hypothetical protein
MSDPTRTNSTDFGMAGISYDSALLEVVGGRLQLKDLRPSGATFFHNFANLADANWSGSGGGSLTGTLSGATVTTAGLDCTGATAKFLTLSATGNADNAQIGTIFAKVRSGHAGNPAGLRYLFHVGGATAANGISLIHTSSGGLQLNITDSSSVARINVNLGTWTPALLTDYKFLLKYDGTTGATQLYIDNVAFGSLITTTFTRSAAGITRINIGTDSAQTGISDFFYKEFGCYSTAISTYPTLSPTIYSTANPRAVVSGYFAADAFISFAADEVAAGSDGFRYEIIASGASKYPTSSTVWAASDSTYAKAASASAIDAAAAALDISNGVQFTFAAFVHSADGTSTPSIGIVTIGYDYFKELGMEPDLVFCTMYVKDSSGTPVEGAKLTVSSKVPYKNGDVQVSPFLTTFESNSLGYIEMHLYETETVDQALDFAIEYPNPNANGALKRYKYEPLVIPHQAEVDLNDELVLQT